MGFNTDQINFVKEYLLSKIEDWQHPFGEDAYMYFATDILRMEAISYFTELSRDLRLIYAEWGEDFNKLNRSYKSRFGVDVNPDELIRIFMRMLKSHCYRKL